MNSPLSFHVIVSMFPRSLLPSTTASNPPTIHCHASASDLGGPRVAVITRRCPVGSPPRPDVPRELQLGRTQTALHKSGLPTLSPTAKHFGMSVVAGTEDKCQLQAKIAYLPSSPPSLI